VVGGCLAPRAASGYSAGMADTTVYHNPVCSKSRGALEILAARGVRPDVIEYLTTPPDAAALARILDLLAGPPADLVRKDKRFRELGLDPGRYVTREQVIALLVEHPELMERPVVIRGGRAVIARPSERVLEIL
jgi:arsenate reductase